MWTEGGPRVQRCESHLHHQYLSPTGFGARGMHAALISLAMAIGFTPARHVPRDAALGASCARMPVRAVFPTMSMVLTEDNARNVLSACQSELATVFGSNPEALKVGITGGVEFVDLDGPTLVVRLTGRFWHARADVLARIEAYVLERIPECIAVDIEDESQLEEDTYPGAPNDEPIRFD